MQAVQAAEVMTVGAASIRPDAPIEEAARLMLDNRVSGLPVINERGQLVGMVTEGDLLRRQDGGGGRPRWLELVLGREPGDDTPRLARLATVADVMTRPVIAVREDAPVQEIADLMEQHGIKRVPVVKDGRVTGIVSRADLLRGLARLADPEVSGTDRVLRQRIIDALARLPPDGWRSVNVAVRHGAVELRGAIVDPGMCTDLLAAVRSVPGIRQLDDRIVVVGPESGRSR